MLSYCFKCSKNIESKNPSLAKTNKGKLVILSKCAVCDSQKARFTEGRQNSQLLSSRGIKLS